jgi:hypothetical protein
MTTNVITSRQWTTVISTADTAVDVLRQSPDHGTAQVPLISRTGFEQRHIVTSQIGSL